MRKRAMLRGAEWMFWAIGFLLLGCYIFVYADRSAHQAYDEWKFNRALKHEPAPVIGFLWHSLRFGAHPFSAHPSSRPSPDESEPLFTAPQTLSRPPALKPGSIVGRLDIPRLGLRTMVLESTDAKTLRIAAGHIEGTALPGEPGNVGIAGHRDTLFRPLRNIRKDDEIDLTTLDGRYRYLVESTRIVSPNDIQVLDSTKNRTLTLVTCYPFYYIGPAPKRFVVHARLETPKAAAAGAGEPATTPPPSRGS